MGMCMFENELYIITEYMDRGNLRDVLKYATPSNLNIAPTQHKKLIIDWKMRIKMAIDIAQGMNYLHSLTPIVIHRDLKSSNILVDKSYNLKVSDFGASHFFEEEDQLLKTFCSTLAWTAPEVFSGNGYSEKADIYSFGIILWELLTCQIPFAQLTEQAIMMGVAQGTLTPLIPTDCLEKYSILMKDCWLLEPNKRPSFEKILIQLKELYEDILEETKNINEDIPEMESIEEYPKQSHQPIHDDEQNSFWAIDYNELCFEEKDIIGHGKYARVYRGKFRQQEVAIKVLKQNPDAESFVEFKKELDIFSRIRSPYLIFFYGACIKPKYCIVTEYISGGTLYDYMKSTSINFSWEQVIKFSQQITRGLHFLHSWKPPVVHRDIKPSNLLIEKGNSIKICDLGLARFTNMSNDITFFKCHGTPAYIAPEVYNADKALNLDNNSKKGDSEYHKLIQSGIKGYSTKSDVYSFAIVLWEMVVRCYMGEYKTPFYSDNKSIPFDATILMQVAKKGLRPKIPEEIPTSLSVLIEWCWNQDFNKRPDCSTIIDQLDHIEQEYIQNKFKWNRCYYFNVSKK